MVSLSSPKKTVVSSLPVAVPPLPDEELAKRVRLSLLAHRPELVTLQVDSLDPGTVRLAGEVQSFYARQIAVELARRVPGVRQVNDGIQVADGTRKQR